MSKTPHQARVEEFMALAGQPTPSSPTGLSRTTRLLRARLILEEALEAIVDGLGVDVLATAGSHVVYLTPESLKSTAELELDVSTRRDADLPSLAKECADLSVVTVGTLSAAGIADEPILEAVDASNLAKFKSRCTACGAPFEAGATHNGEGVAVCTTCRSECRIGHKDERGKWIKPASWLAPPIHDLLCQQGLAEEPNVD